MCDECDTIWLDPNKIDITNIIFPQPPDFRVLNFPYTIKSPESRWATEHEIHQMGWSHFLAD